MTEKWREPKGREPKGREPKKREPKKREPKKREPKKRGSKLLRCGAKRQVTAFAGTRVYLLSLIFFDEGRNWASALHSGEL